MSLFEKEARPCACGKTPTLVSGGRDLSEVWYQYACKCKRYGKKKRTSKKAAQAWNRTVAQ